MYKKGSEGREKKSWSTETAVDADQVGCGDGDGKTATPLTADRFAVAVPGAEDQDTHGSRSGVKQSTPPLVVRNVSRCVRFYEVGRHPYTQKGNAVLCGQCRGKTRWMTSTRKSVFRFSLFCSASLVRFVSNVQNDNAPQNSGYENKAG